MLSHQFFFVFLKTSVSVFRAALGTTWLLCDLEADVCPQGLTTAPPCLWYLGGAGVLLIELVILAALVLVLLVVDFELGTHRLHAVLLDDLVLGTAGMIREAARDTYARGWRRPPWLPRRPQTCWYLDTG